nr:glycosyltransferase [uncultured Flavobacterium sp.]
MDTAFKKEDLEIVLATMNRNSLDFLIPMFPFSDFSNFSILIVNQTQENNLLISEFPSVRVINSFEKGLSKSRNLGLKNAQGKILLIADDDVVFKNDFDSIIIDAYNKFPSATGISFYAEKPDGTLFKRSLSKTNEKISQLELFNILSIEMTFNSEMLAKLELQFDENFGLGSRFKMGEEAIFLSDVQSKNQQLIIEPQVVVIHPTESTDDIISFEERYYIQGAFFKRVTNMNYYFGLFLKVFFDLKQNKIKRSQVFGAIKNANRGKNDFLNY